MLHRLNQDKEAIKTEVASRMLEAVKQDHAKNLLELINDTLYQERERLRLHKDLYLDPKSDKKFYKNLSRKLKNPSERQLIEVVNELIEHYVAEIVGNFNPLMYRVATHVIPNGLTLLLNTLSPLRIVKNFPAIPSIEQTVMMSGDLKRLQRLKKEGHVLVYVPEHLSNLDSPTLGFAIFNAALPPVMYGAGLNLFQMPLFPFFMDRLGAYKVDRLKKADLYKHVLKEFATVTMEYGYDHLFFPGGTRNRSGGVEHKLKKGLLGTALKAFIASRMQNKHQKFYIVPVTVTYHLVLEASTLIEDHLKETGKNRYIIMDDESSKPSVIINFVNRLLSMEGKVFIHFCNPLDPFGNEVNEGGHSIDSRGRNIDMDGYIKRHGTITFDDQRDEVYTNELEQKILSTYLANTVILSTHVAAYVLFRRFRQKSLADLFKFLRDEAYTLSEPFEEVRVSVAQLLDTLRRMEQNKKIRLEAALQKEDAFSVLMNALKYFGVYHENPVIFRQGNRLFTKDPNLLYYYHNKLASYHGLEGE